MPGAYDIYYGVVPDSQVNGVRVFTFTYASAKGISGFQKTVNQWTKCLMTKRGSVISNPSYGTLFADLFNSNTFNVSDVRDRVLVAVEDATAQMRGFQRLQTSTVLTNDEKLATGTLLGVSQLDPSAYTVYVQLTSVLNQSVQLTLPSF